MQYLLFTLMNNSRITSEAFELKLFEKSVFKEVEMEIESPH